MSRGVSTVKAVVALVVVLVIVVGGAFAAGLLGAPQVEDVENRFAAVNDESTTIRTTLLVENPNFFAIDLGGLTVNYTVDLNEVNFARGTKEGVSLSTGNATVEFETVMSNEKIPPWWVAHIRDGETSHLVVNARIHSSTLGRTFRVTPVDREVETDLLSGFASTEPRPVNANQPIVSDPVLYINETSAQWGSVSEDETPMEMKLVLYNPKTTPYTITTLGYEITMNGVPVGSGETDETVTIPGKTERTLSAVTVIQNEKLDEWWVTHLERNQVTDLRIDFYARIDLGGGQSVRVPLDALDYEQTMETDIFGNKNETGPPTRSASGSGNGTTTDSTASASTTTDSNGGTSTTTETTTSGSDTETATSTTTTAGTETTDGGGGLLG